MVVSNIKWGGNDGSDMGETSRILLSVSLRGVLLGIDTQHHVSGLQFETENALKAFDRQGAKFEGNHRRLF